MALRLLLLAGLRRCDCLSVGRQQAGQIHRLRKNDVVRLDLQHRFSAIFKGELVAGVLVPGFLLDDDGV